MYESLTSREPGGDGEALLGLYLPGRRPMQLLLMLSNWEHAPFHQIGMGRGEFLPPLPPCDISTCV